MNDSEDNNLKQRRHGGGIAIGIALGVALGAALDNIGMGIVIGIVLGTAFEWGAGNSSRNQNEADE